MAYPYCMCNGEECKDVWINYEIKKGWITGYYIYSIYMLVSAAGMVDVWQYMIFCLMNE